MVGRFHLTRLMVANHDRCRHSGQPERDDVADIRDTQRLSHRSRFVRHKQLLLGDAHDCIQT